ncbi:hypothetical protein H257_04733 [Aphanomyces astaci]|uniref:Uncharacterized protein n=1 Tax=Aphanomyces astaci TaxID=112090 RepID=W4GVB4_APHAT|nr:hypothetical protein H257_04733 [Aphanomyces astaci]ETV82979.1 hypothetical protein H257_04733 [Aphanomyces astaci]|eukprot:XP_009827650.1 hypothetical protein H257_04733 [Aphanomyces astaci]
MNCSSTSMDMFMDASRSSNLQDIDQLYQLFGKLFMTARDPVTLDTHGHIVAKLGLTKLLAWLVERGLDLDATNHVGNTCVHVAAAHGCMETVLWLIEHGCNALATNYNGLSAFDLASQYSFEHAATLRNFLRNNQDSNQLWDQDDDYGDDEQQQLESSHNSTKQQQQLLVQTLVRRNVTEPTLGLEILELHCPETLESVQRALDLSPTDVATAISSNAKLMLTYNHAFQGNNIDNQLDNL